MADFYPLPILENERYRNIVDFRPEHPITSVNNKESFVNYLQHNFLGLERGSNEYGETSVKEKKLLTVIEEHLSRTPDSEAVIKLSANTLDLAAQFGFAYLDDFVKFRAGLRSESNRSRFNLTMFHPFVMLEVGLVLAKWIDEQNRIKTQMGSSRYTVGYHSDRLMDEFVSGSIYPKKLMNRSIDIINKEVEPQRIAFGLPYVPQDKAYIQALCESKLTFQHFDVTTVPAQFRMLQLILGRREQIILGLCASESGTTNNGYLYERAHVDTDELWQAIEELERKRAYYGY